MFKLQFASLVVSSFYFDLGLSLLCLFFFFFWCFVLLMFGGFLSIATNVMCTMTNGWWVDEKHLLGYNSSLNHNG
jgi:hypothetical protein